MQLLKFKAHLDTADFDVIIKFSNRASMLFNCSKYLISWAKAEALSQSSDVPFCYYVSGAP